MEHTAASVGAHCAFAATVDDAALATFSTNFSGDPISASAVRHVTFRAAAPMVVRGGVIGYSTFPFKVFRHVLNPFTTSVFSNSIVLVEFY